MKSAFIGLSESEVVEFQSTDPAIEAIRKHAELGHDVSFAWLRSQFGRDTGNWGTIDRGRAILKSSDQLSQYLYTHGLMIESQWDNALESYTHDGSPLRVIDYGCGQGLAGLFLAGACNAIQGASEIVLVEPSPIALIRAEAVYRALAPESEITCVCKVFDGVGESDLAHDGEVKSLHLFSNVLDIDGYDRLALLSKALTVGSHTILAVSHDRDHDGGSEGIHSLAHALNGPSMAKKVTINCSEIKQFKCSNPGKSAAICWHCDLDVHDG